MRAKDLILTIVLALVPVLAGAQRTAYGERQVSMDAHFSPSPSYGASVSFGQYLLHGFWEGGLVADNYIKAHEDGTTFGDLRVEGYGAFLFRIFGTRNRAFSVYGGGDAFLGFEFLDPFKQLTEPTYQSLLNEGVKASRFIYGVAPRFEAEFFVSRSIALTARFRIPVTLNLNEKFRPDLVSFTGGIGLRYNF